MVEIVENGNALVLVLPNSIQDTNKDIIEVKEEKKMNKSSPTLIQLIEDIKHKFLILFADHKVENTNLKDDEEINDLREKIALSLCDDPDFNIKISEFMMTHLITFNFQNYINNGLLLKNILED